MAKAKILDDKIVITSDVLTDENLERVSILAPSTLKLSDEDGSVLFEVATSDCNTFTNYGACFKEGKTVGTVSEALMSLDKETKEKKIKTILTNVLSKINATEEAVKEYLETADEINIDVEFMD